MFPPAGFPHSGIQGSQPVCGSPRLIAAYRALPRLRVPRHPPLAFSRLTTPTQSNTTRSRSASRRSTNHQHAISSHSTRHRSIGSSARIRSQCSRPLLRAADRSSSVTCQKALRQRQPPSHPASYCTTSCVVRQPLFGSAAAPPTVLAREGSDKLERSDTSVNPSGHPGSRPPEEPDRTGHRPLAPPSSPGRASIEGR